MGVEIRPLRTLDDLYACEDLQQQIWGFRDRSVVPHHYLRTSTDNGGVVLGAFDGDDAIGFVFSFPGYDALTDRWKHCSLMCGVLPDRQYRGVGTQLKLAQREAVLAQDLDLVTWTFDPLQSLNAYFNLTKLGAIARRYERNFYGDIRDRLNRGLPTDRLTVEWWLESPRVVGHTARSSVPTIEPPEDGRRCLNRVGWTDDGFPINEQMDLNPNDETVWVEIPANVNALKADDLTLAQRWRSEVRETFERAFERGYIAEALATEQRDGRIRSWYRLRRTSLDARLAEPD